MGITFPYEYSEMSSLSERAVLTPSGAPTDIFVVLHITKMAQILSLLSFLCEVKTCFVWQVHPEPGGWREWKVQPHDSVLGRRPRQVSRSSNITANAIQAFRFGLIFILCKVHQDYDTDSNLWRLQLLHSQPISRTAGHLFHFDSLEMIM